MRNVCGLKVRSLTEVSSIASCVSRTWSLTRLWIHWILPLLVLYSNMALNCHFGLTCGVLRISYLRQIFQFQNWRSYTDKHVPSTLQFNWVRLSPPFLFFSLFAFLPLFFSLPTSTSQGLPQEMSSGWSLFSSSASSTLNGSEEQRRGAVGWEAVSKEESSE